MKKIVIILSSILLCLSLWAEERKVELKKEDTKQNTHERSGPSITPLVKLNENTLSLLSEGTFDNVHVVIKTITGETVMADTISLVANQSYTISIENLECDIYVLEIKIGDELYYGYLEIY